MGAQILVVDDNPTNRLVVSTMLRKLGFATTLTENGEQAADAALHEPRPALVFMDIQMPVLDGLDATARIRQNEKSRGLSRLPVIALTADVFDQTRQRCKEADMDDFLTKPVDLNELQSLLSKWLPEG
jgi:two-component system sensor histidine kinase/response regulator